MPGDFVFLECQVTVVDLLQPFDQTLWEPVPVSGHHGASWQGQLLLGYHLQIISNARQDWWEK